MLRKPIRMHFSKEFRIDLLDVLKAQDRINSAAWTKGRRSDTVDFLNPFVDRGRPKSLAAVEATADRTRQDLFSVIARSTMLTFMFGIVLGHHSSGCITLIILTGCAP